MTETLTEGRDDRPTLTQAELDTLGALAQAYNRFVALPVQHHADEAEFVHAIHAAQNIVLARVGLRVTGVYRPHPPETKGQEIPRCHDRRLATRDGWVHVKLEEER